MLDLLLYMHVDNATFQLKEQYIPPNGVVLFDDIGGIHLGVNDGLFCAVNNINVPLDEIYWAFPDNRPILNAPYTDRYGNGTCHDLDHCTSLHYNGTPPERGQFKCILLWNPGVPGYPIEYEIVPVNIVDMNVSNITGPNNNNMVTAGDNIELSVSVSVYPDNTHIPYQWQLNGNDLSDSDTYNGTNTATLRITNIQDENKGEYRVSVAHSESHFTNTVTVSISKCT